MTEELPVPPPIEKSTVEIKYKKFKTAFTSKNSQQLTLTQDYLEEVKNVLQDRVLLQYVLEIHPEFIMFYRDIIQEKRKHFIQIEDPISDLALCWLFITYH